MMNDYEEIGNDTVAIILRDKQGKEKAKTLIDKEDLERVLSNGYTWFYFKTPKGEPYAVANTTEGRIYLHRFIMNTSKGMVTDHVNHDTLDNRKQNLVNATKSENQQNRKGARKGSRSGIRGVSWDETNQDWIVVVKGKYYGRFKEIEKAKELANEKIKEVMPYINEKGGSK
ncbi:HNH endonuclease [Neobacillus niacini]